MRRTLFSLCGLLSLALVGCGVPTDEHPRDISARKVPFDLLESSTTTSTLPPPVASVATTIYLVSEEQLVPVSREVLAPPLVSRVLATLLRGPTAEESARGVRTAVPNDARLLSARTSVGVLTVDLSKELVTVSGQEQILALAQIVFTATGNPEITAVRFALDDEPVEVPRADGTLTSAPLGRADYQELLSPTG